MESLNARCFYIQVLISTIATFLLVASARVNHHIVDRDGYPSWLSTSDRIVVSQLQSGGMQPNAIVANDGSGQYTTVTDGINSYPTNFQGTYIIYVKAGIYQEYVTVDQSKHNILLYGDGPTKTIITGNKNKNQGLSMPETATFTTFAENFTAKYIKIENTADATGEQAVAIRVVGDRSAFYNCAFRSHQDTLFVDNGRQFYRDCEISGTIDFIYGRSSTLIQNSQILVRKPLEGQSNVVVADGTSAYSRFTTGIVLQNCSILPDNEFKPYLHTTKTYLARPWGQFSTAVFLENYIADFIQMDGYLIWSKDQPNIENPYFAEFGNTGPGANATARVSWAKGLISKKAASIFTAEQFIHARTWLPATGIPYDHGLKST
ncbi:pectinesterase [Trifolium pratense]|uniref:pectinesterase n=4 Tax=Trifolium pratense TaxID=57577 RepID=A0A2K3NZ47_TRIPR|nr:pectinesterase 4-like [Trifolium pratense]PNY08310.1 pectinesterase [Trifolium pratense]